MNRFFLFLPLILILSCQEQPELTPAMIEAELKPFVDQFYAEAELRGISLAENIDALISDEITACGEGHSPDFNGRYEKPTILISDDCWAGLDEIARERLVFHELGHALLSRIHIDGLLPNGHAKSIMCAGADFSCSNMPNYQVCPEHRAYYVDELFNQETSTPAWSQRSWEVLGNVLTDFDANYSTSWSVFTDCPPSSFEVSIDSSSQNRPSSYSLRMFSDCGDFLTIRRRIAIGDPASAEAIRLKFDAYQDLSGDGFRMSMFVKDTDGSFSAFIRTTDTEIIDANNVIDAFTLQAECLTAEADSLIFDFNFLPNTEGEIFIGNLAIELME